MSDKLKKELKQKVGKSRFNEVFDELLDVHIRPDSPLFNKFVTLRARTSKATDSERLGLIDFETGEIPHNNVALALCEYIDQIQDADLLSTPVSDSPKESPELPLTFALHHAYSTNRSNQTYAFQQQVELNLEKKILTFYLYGDANQAHDSLCKRFGLEFTGHFEDYLTSNFTAPWAHFAADINIDLRPGMPPAMAYSGIIRKIFAAFELPVKPFGMEKADILDLLKSPKLAKTPDGPSFGADDMVFLLLTLDARYWDKVKTPELVVDFLERFCAATLPAGAPRFFLFLGVRYDKNEPQKRQEVREVILERTQKSDVPVGSPTRGMPLEELTPVSLMDMELWFYNYEPVFDKYNKSPQEMAKSIFLDRENYDMKQLEAELKRFIEAHNKGLALG